jgi:hypothetical protein
MIIHNPSFAAFCGVLLRFAAFCGVLQHFAAFCGILRHVGNKFLLQDQIFGGGSNPCPLFWSVENNCAKMGGQWPPFPPENIFSGFFLRTTSRSSSPTIFGGGKSSTTRISTTTSQPFN